MILAKHVFDETVNTDSFPVNVKALNGKPLLGTVFVKSNNLRKTIKMLFLSPHGKPFNMSNGISVPKPMMETAFQLYTAVSTDDTKFETDINIYSFGSILLTTEFVDSGKEPYILLKLIDIIRGELSRDELPITNGLLTQLSEASKVYYAEEGVTRLSFLRFEKNSVVLETPKINFIGSPLEGHAVSHTVLYGEQVIRRFLYEVDYESRKLLAKQS